MSPADAPVVTGEPTSAGTDEPAKPEEAPAAPRSEKPILVLVTPTDSVESFDKVDKVILSDEKVAIGSWAFRRVKMTPEEVEKDPLLADKGKEVPRFLFISADYKDVSVIEGSKLSTSGVWNAMKAAAKKHYKGNFDKIVRDMRDVLIEYDKISKELRVLEEKEKREDKPTPADLKEMERKKTELEERQKKADEKKEELLKFEVKVQA